MTTIGKILVFLVFAAALIMGGLMVFVSRTTPDWANAVKERDEKIAVFKSILDQESDSRRKLLRDNEKLKQLLESKVTESGGVRAKLDEEKKQTDEQLKAARLDKEKADLNLQKATAEASRLQQELQFVQNELKDREKMINKFAEDITQARNAEQAAKNDAVTAANRLQSLNELLKEKERELAELTKKSQPSAVAGTGPRDPGYNNPPPVYVKGRVEQVDEADKSLVKISIGSDSGIRKDQTLEVYRTSPRAEYLGRVVIVNAGAHDAFARIVRMPGLPLASLQPGDQVASTIRP
jgi:hypothetical protein